MRTAIRVLCVCVYISDMYVCTYIYIYTRMDVCGP